MTRDELYALVWSKPVTEVGLLVGLSGNGLAKACRRHGIQVPPRGYWQRLEAGQLLERAPPPENGQIETGVHLKGSRRPVRKDATGAMLRRRVARAPAAAVVAESPPATDDVEDECARILMQGLRQQLRNAAASYLAGVAESLPTLDDATARAAAGWLKAARSTLASAGPAEEASQALRARSLRPESPQAWLNTLMHASPTGPPRRPARHDPQ